MAEAVSITSARSRPLLRIILLTKYTKRFAHPILLYSIAPSQAELVDINDSSRWEWFTSGFTSHIHHTTNSWFLSMVVQWDPRPTCASRFITLSNARWRARLSLGEKCKVWLIESAHYHFGDCVTERIILKLMLYTQGETLWLGWISLVQGPIFLMRWWNDDCHIDTEFFDQKIPK